MPGIHAQAVAAATWYTQVRWTTGNRPAGTEARSERLLAYEERVSSRRTEAIFIGLSVLFLLLFAVRVTTGGLGLLAGFFLLACSLFTFYALNYRVLVIRETLDALELEFGLLRWVVPWRSIEDWDLDDVSLWRIAGAGVHFTFIRGHYRVFLNFLEHARVVLNVTPRRGIVRAVAFSTSRPADVLALVAARAGEQAEPIVASNMARRQNRDTTTGSGDGE